MSVPGGGRLRAGGTFVVAATYCLLFLVRPGPTWPDFVRETMTACTSAVYSRISLLLEWIGVHRPEPVLGQGLYLVVVTGLVPLLAARLLMRAPLTAIGCRRPNRVGWHLLAVAFVLSIPFLVFMALGPGMVAFYMPTVKRAGYALFLSYYAINMLTEHFFLHGVMLAALRSDWRWPTPAPGPEHHDGRLWRRLLAYIGLGGPSRYPGQSGIAGWLQLAPGCVFAMVGSAALFALVHVGKDWREAVLSIPGGLAVAYIAYRSDSWLTPFLLHAMTAGATLVLMILLPTQ